VGHRGHDTIGDFTPDKIKLDYAAFTANDANSFNAWVAAGHATTANGSDVLIDLNLNGVDTILLKNVTLANLHANLATSSSTLRWLISIGLKDSIRRRFQNT
jgi:hypothetical protein